MSSSHGILGLVSIDHISPAPRGRPPNPDIEPRAFSVSIELFTQVGWAGFTLDSVASRARIGKAALYRRWTTKQDLLIQAVLATAHEQPLWPDTGCFQVDLTEYVEKAVVFMASQRGLAELRLQLEAKIYPEILGKALDESRREWIASARAGVLAAVARGELPQGTSPGLIFDTTRGAVINRFLLLPTDHMADFLDRRKVFAGQLVRLVLTGLGASTTPDKEPL